MNTIEEFSLSEGRFPSSDKIISRKLIFELPFVIMVEDNLGNGLIQSYHRGEKKYPQTASDKEKSTTIDFTPSHNFPNQTALDSTPPYVVNSKYGLLRISLLKVNSEGLSEHPLDSALDHEFMGSISKSLGYTCVMVELSESTHSIDFSVEENQKVFLPEVIEAFNKFLLYYKLLSNRLYIPSVTIHTIGKFTLVDLFENQSTQHLIFFRCWEQPVPFSKVIPKDIDKTIRQWCMNDQQVDLFSVLRYEAWNKIVLQEWRMAVINSVIWLESWITPTLQDMYALKGLDSGQIKAKFMTDEPKKKDRKHLGILEIIEKLVMDATRFDFGKTSEFNDVKHNAIILRNSIIHRSKLDVTQQDAYACIHAVSNAITLITQACISYSRHLPNGSMWAIAGYDVMPR